MPQLRLIRGDINLVLSGNNIVAFSCRFADTNWGSTMWITFVYFPVRDCEVEGGSGMKEMRRMLVIGFMLVISI
jgi:hypothetical protein